MVKLAADVPDDTDTDIQTGKQHPTRCEEDPIVEATQITVPLMESHDIGGNLRNMGDQLVDEVTDVEVNDTKDGEMAVEGQSDCTVGPRDKTTSLQTGERAKEWWGI
jgi:hypothetical protein